MKALTRKTLAVILAVVFVVSGSITTMLVFAQVVPDYRQMRNGGTEISRKDPAAPLSHISGEIDYQPFQVPAQRQQAGQHGSSWWTFDISGTTTLDINLMAIDVEIIAYDGDQLTMDFKGWKYPLRSGEYPEVIATGTTSTVTVRETRTQNGGSYRNNEGLIEGVLTIKVPRAQLVNVEVNTYSGSIAGVELQAVNFITSSSSGSAQVLNMTATNACEINTYSGSVRLEKVAASRLNVDSSSGSMEGHYITADTFSGNWYSGSATLSDVGVNGTLELSASSGKINVQDANCQKLSVTTYSGDAVVAGTIVSGDISVNTSSGAVKMTDVSGGRMEAVTFSGAVNCERLTANDFEASTSSGSVKAQMVQGCNIDVSTFSGSVELVMPQSYEFQLDFSTFSGGNNIGFPITLNSKDNKNIEGVVGAGTYEVDVSTSSGSLSIQPGN